MGAENGWVLWFTGMPASGKSTLAFALQERLYKCGVGAIVLDSDALRAILTPDATYTPAERDAFYARLIDLAELLTQQGANVLIAATANRRAYRDAARARFAAHVHFAEVWVHCSLDTCRARDPKGLYARLAGSAASQLPGAGAAYEPPQHAEVLLNTDELMVDEALEQLHVALDFLPEL